MDLTSLALQTATSLVLAAVLVGLFTRSATDPKEVAAWARGQALDLTARNRPIVTYYVRLSITLRVIGGVAGLFLGALFDDAMGLATSAGVGFWVWIVLGWLTGAGWAEYRLTRAPNSSMAASLTPRALPDYLSPRLKAAPAIAAGLVVVLAVGGLLAPEPDTPQTAPPPAVGLALAATGAALIAVLVTAAMRAVVDRRQPTGPPDVVAADDAIRSSAVHNLAGGGAAAILLVAAQVAWSVLSPHQVPLSLRALLPAALMLAALVSWRWYAYRGWRVRRSSRLSAGTS
jgi:hypothetical protein